MKLHELPAQFFHQLSDTTALLNAAPTSSDATFRDVLEQQLQKIMDGLSPEILVGMVSVNGHLTYVNRASQEALGYTRACVVGRPLEDAVWWPATPASRDRVREAVQRGQQGETSRFDMEVIAKNGPTLTLDIMLVPLFDDAGKLSMLLLSGRDITERVLAQAHNTYLTTHDALTDLANRQSFLGSIKNRLEREAPAPANFSILALGLDRMSWVNEAMGPAAGDLLLQSFAQRLGEVFALEAVTARLGGDVFAILLPAAPLGAALAKARAIQQRLDTPFIIHGRPLYLSFCVGVTQVDLAQAKTEEPQALLQQAETALCYAKLQGPGSVSPFVAPEPSSDLSRLFLLSDLHDAVPRGELVVYYQPQWNAKTNRVTGAEALVRWRHPEHGLISPDRFIPIAEDSGLILPIGAWVLRQACIAAVGWQDAGFDGLHVSVNVSPRQLRGTDFPAIVLSILKETGLPPERLVLEVTESALMENIEHVSAMLGSLRDAGISIALDDFGSGYSSLGQLRKLPIDLLKIDRALVPDVAEGAESASITRAIITMAASLKLQVLAEGVESRSQLELLANSGCHLMQGYYLSAPVQEADLVKLFGRRVACEQLEETSAAQDSPLSAKALVILQPTC